VQTRMLYTRLCKGDSTILCTYNTKSTIVCNSKKKFTIELIKTFLLPLNKKVRVSFNFIDCSHLKCFKLCKTSFLLLFSWFFFKFHSCLLDQLVNLAIYCSFDLNIVFLWRKDMNVQSKQQLQEHNYHFQNFEFSKKLFFSRKKAE
jgi:hypothetical protein